MKRTKQTIAALLLTAFTILAWQTGEIPPANDPTHPGQPLFCQNYKTKDYPVINCSCKPKPGSEGCKEHDAAAENAHCSVYCRKEACRCSEMCTTRMRERPAGHAKVAE